MKQIILTIILLAVLTIPFAPPPEEPEAYATEQTVEVAPEFEPWDIPLTDDLQKHIRSLCDEHNVSYAMVIAMIGVESGFDSRAVSDTGDYGLLQINSINHKNGVDYLNPYDNVTHGIRALGRLAKKYGDADLVAMCWNCGETGARKLWEQGIYSTDYSSKVLSKKLEYENRNRSNL